MNKISIIFNSTTPKTRCKLQILELCFTYPFSSRMLIIAYLVQKFPSEYFLLSQYSFFYVLLTVYLSIILVINQLNSQILVL